MDSTVWRVLARELAGELDASEVVRVVSSPRSLEIRFGSGSALVLSAEPALPRMELRQRGARGVRPGESTTGRGFPGAELSGLRLDAVDSVPWERELHLRFGGTQGRQGLELVFRPIPARPLLMLAIPGSSMIASWPSLPPGQAPPGTLSAARPTPDALTVDVLRKAIAQGKPAPLAEHMRRLAFGLSPAVAREIAHRAGLAGTVVPPMPEDAALHALESACQEVVAESGGIVRVYLPAGFSRDAAVHPEIATVSLSHLAPTHVERGFDTAAEGARLYWNELRAWRETVDVAREARSALHRAHAHESALVNALETELATAGDGENARRAGELIVAHLPRIAPGASEARLPDAYDPDEREVTVVLDPGLSAQANAERYFRRARRAARALHEIPARLAATRARLARIEHHAASLDTAATSEAVMAAAEAARSDPTVGLRHPRSGSGGRSPATDPEPVARRLRGLRIRPRRIALAPGWIALIGRTSSENDVLTTRAAAPHDLWFHARGFAGSHVVVIRPTKTSEPPREVVERAARAAAWYSQGRTSSLVSVAWTEARYVRKPRGAAPGLVTLLREKVVMVVPEEPSGGPEGP